MSFLEFGATGFSKMFYWQLLNTINRYEKNSKKPLNKGMACGNLGVSALAEGDVDGGITYLIWAAHEDRAWAPGDATRNSFDLPLYVQFAAGISQFGGLAPWLMLKNAIKEYNVAYKENIGEDAIFRELEGRPEHRALLEGSLWAIHRNLSLLKEEKSREIYKENNIFTKLRLFDGVVNLCRLVELGMKYHEDRLKILKAKDLNDALKKPLGNLLKAIFGNEGWYKTDVEDKNKKPQTPTAFDAFIARELPCAKTHAKSILLLLTSRNYITHVSNPATQLFFEKFDEIFNEIMAAYLYYLRYRKIIV
jgi:hypothetical protein